MAKKGVASLESMMASRNAAKPAEAHAQPGTTEAAPMPGAANKPINIFVTEADRIRLRMFALERKTSVQALGTRAWNLLLKEEGLPPLAPASAYVPNGTKRRKD